jgi:hypothetical protein
MIFWDRSGSAEEDLLFTRRAHVWESVKRACGRAESRHNDASLRDADKPTILCYISIADTVLLLIHNATHYVTLICSLTAFICVLISIADTVLCMHFVIFRTIARHVLYCSLLY